MRSKEVEEAIKEGKDYIEFMTTAGDNAEWAKTVLSYIETLEKLPNKIRDKIKIIDGYSKMAKEEITERVVIADTNSLNYGRMEAHNADIYHLKEIIEGEK